MSLFGSLPPPTAHLRPKQQKLEEEYKPKALSPSGPDEAAEDQGGAEHPDRPDKRQRIESQNNSGLSEEQIAAALAKIGSHISNPDKFSKAAGLLRQLLDSGALTKAHREQLFDAVKGAFSDFDNASEASLRRDYMKLCHSLDKRAAELLSRAQRAQLEVYRIVGFTQNEMHTDDSFVFNKVLGRIKEAVVALPPATEEDEEALAELQAAAAAGISSSDEEDAVEEGGEAARRRRGGDGGLPGGSGSSRGAADEAAEAAAAAAPPPPPPPAPAPAEGGEAQAEVREGPPEAAPGASAAGERGNGNGGEDNDNDDEDPFGLNQLLPVPKRPPPPPPPPASASHPHLHSQHAHHTSDRQEQDTAGCGGGRSSSSVWTAAQALVMRRQALIECLITARGFHKTPWARTSVELLVEHFAKHRDRFTGEQQLAVEEMVRFVRAARQARPTGPSQKEINRDTTSFERARSEWSKVHVSARGKVGASGDAKANNWLG